MVLIGIKRPLQLDELTYAWASKLGVKGSLSNTSSKVCGFGSLDQNWVRITKIQIACYRMKEFITLHHGNFAIKGKQVEEFAQRTGCSNQVEHRSPSPTCFWMRWRKSIHGGIPPAGRSGACFCWNECCTMLQLCSIESSKGTSKDSHCIQLRQPLSTLACGTSCLLQSRSVRVSMWLSPVCSPMCSKKISWRSCKGSSLDAWPQLAYEAKGGQLNCLLEAGGAPEVWMRRIRPLR